MMGCSIDYNRQPTMSFSERIADISATNVLFGQPPAFLGSLSGPSGANRKERRKQKKILRTARRAARKWGR